MSEHLATSERVRIWLHCELCVRVFVERPAVLCDACVAYLADCEAEVSEVR